MGFKCQSKFSFSSLIHFRSRNNTHFFPLRIERNPPNPPQQDSPVPGMPHKKTPWQPTPGLSGTQWSEDLSHKPSQHNEPPIPGPSPSSEPPEVALMQSTEDPFACPATPCSVIIIDNTPIGSPPPSTPTPVSSQCPQEPQLLLPPGAKLPSFPQ
ncbi:hypothetical protein O181_068854 [Austropuccinia psidii MF-1]|uniref:Uncharacterized protein n=1 Tax=Austropuccinia psidii MF-1 TaxID=1389203 RepID=A0A9Q3EXN8_9BASI|nr:hypothetical protein [Austropuccinia psidii MF-1]